MAEDNLNVFDPAQMGWLGAREGAVGSLTGIAPVAALAGAGLGALLSPKKRLRGALMGGAAGGLLGIGGNAAFSGLMYHNDAETALDTAAQQIQERYGSTDVGDGSKLRSLWASHAYLKDLYADKVPTSSQFKDLSQSQITAVHQDTPTSRWYWPGKNTPPMALTEANAARQQLVRDNLQQSGTFPRQALQEVGVDAARYHARDLATALSGKSLLSGAPDQRLADYVVGRYKHR